MRTIVLVSAVIALIAAGRQLDAAHLPVHTAVDAGDAPGPGASILCARKSGAVFLRQAPGCPKKETRVDPVRLGLLGPPGTAGRDGRDGRDGVDGQDGEDADETLLPIAFGVINPDGSTASGTGNFEVTLNAAAGAYEIAIDDEPYAVGAYATVVTAISTDVRSATTAQAAGGRLAVKIFDASGAAVADNFSFVVYRAFED